MASTQYAADEEMGEAVNQRQLARKTKGRGFQERDAMDAEEDRGGQYDTHAGEARGPIKCRICYEQQR